MKRHRNQARLWPYVAVLAHCAYPGPSWAQPGSTGSAGNALQQTGQAGRNDGATSADDMSMRLPDAAPQGGGMLVREPRTSRSVEDRTKAVAVLDRKRLYYDPIGLPVGAFSFYPSLGMSANGTSNIFSQSNPASDLFLTLKGEGLLRSNWNRHLLLVRSFVAKDLHAEYTTENNFSYRTQGMGRLDLGEANSVSLEAVHERFVLDRGGTGDILVSRRPTHYKQTGVDLSAKAGGRRRWVGKVRLAYDDRVYADGENLDGSRLDLSFRSFKDYTISGQVGYKVGPDKTIFIAGSRMWRRFDQALGDSRNVDVSELLAGIEGDVTPVIRGRFGLGYIHANFVSPAFRTTKGIAIDARVDFLVTELTTIQISGRRELRNVAGITASAALNTKLKISIDHEFLRNVIISPSLSYEYADYVESDRSAALFNADTTVRWLISPRLRVTGNIGFRRRDAANFPIRRDFSAFNASVGITAQF